MNSSNRLVFEGQSIFAGMSIPAICAPMFLVSGPQLVLEACRAGLIGALPRQNARSIEQFDQWLGDIRTTLAEHGPAGSTGPLAVNVPAKLASADLAASLDVAAAHGVRIVISVGGGPREVVKQAHARAMFVFHDVTTIRFAEKALDTGVDGLIAIGGGGGGHSGPLSHIALIPKIRALFDGPLVMAGAISNGAGIRAAQALGADFAYIGTRFIATKESNAPAAYKKMIVDCTSTDLIYSASITGVPANWLVPSLLAAGLDPIDLPMPGKERHSHLPSEIRPWRDIWSAGQGIDLIDDIPSVAELVTRMKQEFAAASSLNAPRSAIL